MAMLDRYKKKGGFFQLLQLLETSPTAKREQFLALIAAESPAWEEALRKRMLTINRVYSWEPQFLVEIFSRLSPLTLANALHGNSAEDNEKLLSCLPPISRRRISDQIADSNPIPAEKNTCIAKILSEVRGFALHGILRLDKIDPDLAIPDNIEEMLNVSGFILNPEMENSNDETKTMDLPTNGSDTAIALKSTDQTENEFLKRKISQLATEVNSLKNENQILKDKLFQIKKIA
ncbi:MAG: FliG C-terminal domain-containing protein [Pseudobdellovibrionaceae bacterium]